MSTYVASIEADDEAGLLLDVLGHFGGWLCCNATDGIPRLRVASSNSLDVRGRASGASGAGTEIRLA